MALFCCNIAIGRAAAHYCCFFFFFKNWCGNSQREKSICDRLCVSICLQETRNENFWRWAMRLCLLCIRRTDGMSTDYSSSLRQRSSSSTITFFLLFRKTTDYIHKQQRAAHGESDRVRYTHTHTSRRFSCVQSIRSIKLRLRDFHADWLALVCPLCIYRYTVYIYIHACMYRGERRERKEHFNLACKAKEKKKKR